MVKLGASNFQNTDAHLPKAEFGMKGISRGMTPNWFVREMANKDQLQRTWLMYSPIKEAAFCFCCMLFRSSPQSVKSSFECENWFTKWKKFHKVRNNEENQYHRQSFLKWKELERIMKSRSIDENLDKQFRDEKNRWREILKRLRDVIKLLASQSLAFRGHDETPNTNNSGKCLAVLHFLTKHDPIIDSHLSSLLRNTTSV